MKNTIILVGVMFLILSCNRTSQANAGQRGTEIAVTHYSETELAELQHEVDLGHQPWRLDPKEVARSYLSELKLASEVSGEPIIKDSQPQSIALEFKGKRKLTVYLHKLKDGNGIWYVEKLVQ